MKVVHRETLGTMRQTIHDLTHALSVTETAAMLAITTKPDAQETVRDDYDPRCKYVIRAYGLTRADGGYVSVRFICKGQRDSVSFFLFDNWRQHKGPFTDAAERINRTRYDLLNAGEGK